MPAFRRACCGVKPNFDSDDPFFAVFVGQVVDLLGAAYCGDFGRGAKFCGRNADMS
jgi:hypothetical protein